MVDETSNMVHHTLTDQHAHAMLLLKKELSDSADLGPSSYAPITKALNVLPEDSKVKHFVATEKLAFTKCPVVLASQKHTMVLT